MCVLLSLECSEQTSKYINGFFSLKIAINAISGDSLKELERAPSFATTENIIQTVITNSEFVVVVIVIFSLVIV